jgi:hypothetical protein
MQSPTQVQHSNARVVDMLAKAGVDLSTSPPANLAAGASVTASHVGSGTSTGSAIDGFPTNEPFWGAGGSPNSQDWYEVNFNQTRTVNEVWLYFKDSRPQSATYRAPSSYNIQYLNGSTWTTVSNQVKSPSAPAGNFNKVQFTPVSAQRIRVLATNASGAKTGLTEVKMFNRGGIDPQPNPNLALSAMPSCSFTSAWESCAAINNGDEPASSNIPGPNQGTRWGNWSNQGQGWAELTWSSAQTLSRAQVYFFDDNQGIDLPSSWSLQYWNGSAYVNVPGASYTTLANQYNTVNFTATSTTRLRVLLNGNGTLSVGLLEVKAFAS